MARLEDITVCARLDKTRTKVLCGYHLGLDNNQMCEGDGLIAYITELSIDGAQPGRHLLFPAGWDEINGVWRETPNARRRRIRSHTAKTRRSPFRTEPTRGPRGYPAYACCQISEFHVQRLDPDILDVQSLADLILQQA